jgi:uncharacterized OB-fold protein
MMKKTGSAPITATDSKPEVDSGIAKCANCGNVYLAARGKCPNCG